MTLETRCVALSHRAKQAWLDSLLGKGKGMSALEITAKEHGVSVRDVGISLRGDEFYITVTKPAGLWPPRSAAEAAQRSVEQ